MNNNEIIMEDNDKIFRKWKELQDIVIGEKYLIDSLLKDKNNDYIDIKNLICDYSETKCKILQLMNKNNNEINKVNENDVKIEFFQEDNSLYQNIEKFLFFLRKNIDYVMEMILIIGKENNSNSVREINSFIDLLLYNFYDEFPIKEKSKNKQIMLIIYKLLENEIYKMDFAISDTFITSNYILDRILSGFLYKNDFLKYLEKILNPLVNSIEKEVEEKNIVNLSLIEIQNNIISKINPNDNDRDKIFKKRKSIKENKINYEIPSIEEIDKTELIYYIWKNQEEFFNDLTQENLFRKIQKEKNDEIKNIILKKAFIRNINSNQNRSLYSNEKLVEILNTKYFETNLELIVKEYKSNYLFIHQKIDSFLLELIGKVNEIPNNIRYICKMIYLLISAKFPDMPKYLKNSFIGKFFFDKYIFPSLSFENSLLFNEKIISKEIKKCFGEIISIISHANNCVLFDCFNNIEKTVFNNYITEIIPILDNFYNSCINIELPEIFNELINSKIKEINKDKTIKKKLRRRKGENIDKINNENIFLSEILKNKNTKNKLSKIIFSQKFKFISFSLKNLLFILSLISENKTKFSKLPKNAIFNNLFDTLYNKKKEIENLLSNNNEKLYLIYEKPKNNLIKLFRNIKKNNRNIFLLNSNTSKKSNLNHIKFSLKTLLEELNFVKASNSNKIFFKLLLYLSIKNNDDDNNYSISYSNNNVPLYWFAIYLDKNINNLEEKYIKNDYIELFNELHQDELYNQKMLNQYLDKIIIKNEEKIKLSKKNINKLKFQLKKIRNSYLVKIAENIIFSHKIEAYIIFNTNKNKKNKNEDIPIITIENTKIDKSDELKISTVQEFINLFLINFVCEQKVKPYDLLLFDIINGENKNQIYDLILKYLSIIKRYIKSIYFNIQKKDLNEIIDIIKEYIIESLYKLVFPKDPIEKDISFYNQTRTLDWLTKENFGIKDMELYQINYPQMLMKKFEESKSLKEKINYIKLIYNYINLIFKYNTGKEDDIDQDEATPFVHYLIIKCQPERIISNINFIKNFLSEDELMSDKGFYVSQFDSAIVYILSINHTHLDMTEENFKENIQKSKIKNKI